MTRQKQRGLVWLAALSLLAIPVLAAAQETVDVTGTWEISWEGRQGGMRVINIAFQQDGQNLTGIYKTAEGQDIGVIGTIEGNKINFRVAMQTQRGEITLRFKGTVEGETMSGTLTVGDSERPWTGKKIG